MSSTPSYSDRVESQVSQFADKEALVPLPKIYQYWNQNYIVPKLLEAFGYRNLWEIYARSFIEAANDKAPRVLSVGSGDGIVEVRIASKMLELGCDDFTFVATELSDIRLDRARQNAEAAGLSRHFEFEQVDVNETSFDENFTGAMAQHTLHHIVELEALFQNIRDLLTDDGVFVVVDMIGRNGHMRWPETLAYVERFWEILPEKYKYNHQFKKTHHEYVNWDCSIRGFEGIRSQDILQLLREHFSFSAFACAGGFVDVFVERGYGHNFDREDPHDLALIDVIAELNDALLQLGNIKPTMMFATCHKPGRATSERTFGGLSSAQAVRLIDAPSTNE